MMIKGPPPLEVVDIIMDELRKLQHHGTILHYTGYDNAKNNCATRRLWLRRGMTE